LGKRQIDVWIGRQSGKSSWFFGNRAVAVSEEREQVWRHVKQYKALKPDLVTMDIVMPDMAGIDAVRAIVKEFPQARILMCSAMGQQALVIEAIQAGARDFVVKPFQPSRVLEAVQRVLG
jgi:two-component system chemotaxis response regulator CheY